MIIPICYRPKYQQRLFVAIHLLYFFIFAAALTKRGTPLERRVDATNRNPQIGNGTKVKIRKIRMKNTLQETVTKKKVINEKNRFMKNENVIKA